MRTPRLRVDGDRWLRRHFDALVALESIRDSEGDPGELGRIVEPGDLVVLREGEMPRVRVVLAVEGRGSDGKISIYDPGHTDGIRRFMASRVTTLPWLDLSSQFTKLHA